MNGYYVSTFNTVLAKLLTVSPMSVRTDIRIKCKLILSKQSFNALMTGSWHAVLKVNNQNKFLPTFTVCASHPALYVQHSCSSWANNVTVMGLNPRGMHALIKFIP